MSYEIPDFSTPLTQSQAQRLRKYCINASTFISNKFLYSKKQTIEFLTYKKRIPEIIDVYTVNKNKENNDDINKNENKEISDYAILEDVIAELEDNGVFKDREYAKSKAESYLLRRKGADFIRRELKSKKFDENIVDEIVNELIEHNNDEYDNAFRLSADSITRKSNFKKKEPNARKQMFITTLVRKGYDMSDIFELTEEDEYAHFFQ